jgi:hypothetical protein
MLKNKYSFSQIQGRSILGALLLSLSLSSFSANIHGDNFKIEAIPISDNVSALIRLLCYQGNSIIVASNSKGSDMLVVEKSNCKKDEVKEYSYVFATRLNKNLTGIFRSAEIGGYKITIYSAKGQAPVLALGG